MKSIESMGSQLRKVLYQNIADSKLKRTKANPSPKDPKRIIEKAIEECKFNSHNAALKHILVEKNIFKDLLLLTAKLHNKNIRLKKGMKDET